MTDMQHAVAIAMTEEHKGYPISLRELASAIRRELDRQQREHYDHLNDTAPVPAFGPEERSPA